MRHGFTETTKPRVLARALSSGKRGHEARTHGDAILAQSKGREKTMDEIDGVPHEGQAAPLLRGR